MQMTKKVLSIVLAVLMVASMMVVGTVVASADGNVAKIGDTQYATFADAWNAAADGDTITLLQDCAGNGLKTSAVGKYPTGLTVDFNGKTYTVDGSLVGSTGTETQAFQLLKDNKITFKNGTIYSAKAKILVQNYSNLTLKNMTLDLDNPNYAYAYTLSNNCGEVIIDDTTIKANPAGGYAFDVCGFSTYPSVSVTVTGDSAICGNIEVSAPNGNVAGLDLNLESGAMSGDVVLDDATVPATDAANIIDQEGAFLTRAVAMIGSKGYTSFEAAWNAAVDGDTITLLQNCDGNGLIAPQSKFKTKGLTVDFNNFTYTVSGTPVGSTGTESIGFQLLKGNKIIFKNGAITADCRDNPRDGKYLQRMIQNYSDLTLDNMDVSMIGAYYDQTTMATANGSTTIKDSTVSAPDFSRYSDYGYVSSDFGGVALNEGTFGSYPSVKVTVTGNSLIDGDISIDDENDAFTLNLEGGAVKGAIILDANAQATYDANPDAISQSDSCAVYAAKIGTTYYETLEAAWNAAVDGDTIKVINDCAGNGLKAPQGKYTQGLTVDFNDHTYTQDGTLVGSTGTETQAFQLLKDNNITFKNGTITSEKAKMLIQNYSNLTLDNMTLDLNNPGYSYAYTLSNNNGDVVIKDTMINANRFGGFAFDVCRFASYPSVNVTLTGDSIINGNVEVDAKNGDAKNGFSLNLVSGALNGDISYTNGAKTAIATTPEKAKVTMANTFSETAPDGFILQDNGNGTSTVVPDPNPLNQLLTNYANDGNNFGISGKYLHGTLLGVQKKDAVAEAGITSEGAQETGADIRFVAVLDTGLLQAADDYGFVLAKVSNEKNSGNTKFENLKANWGNGEKTVSAMGTSNNVCGDPAYGDPTNTTTAYKYVTCAVNGMDDSSKVVARFYVTIGGKTYYAKYQGSNFAQTGIVCGMSDLTYAG